jgi:hypothetical protein
MSERAPLRVVATHDFCCAYPPSLTSYGSLPGGEGLKMPLSSTLASCVVWTAPSSWSP